MTHDDTTSTTTQAPPEITPPPAPRPWQPPDPTFDDKAKDDANAALEQIKAREKKTPPKVSIYDYAKLTGRPLPEGLRPFVAFYDGGDHGKKRETAARVKECPTMRAGLREARIMNEAHEEDEKRREQERQEAAKRGKKGAR